MGKSVKESVICVVGLGYVGFPLAEAFSEKLKVYGYDKCLKKINELKNEQGNSKISFTSDPSCIKHADYIFICVPTPVTRSKQPDLSYVENAARTVGKNMKKGATVVLESTVYPGATEDFMKPILEESGLKCGTDFKIGYSPERINPGDSKHSVKNTIKAVAGMDEEATCRLMEVYSLIADNVRKAPSIKTAEAAKVIENTQRDLNIALINELAMIFSRIGICTKEVLEIASTKWNFHHYVPGMVGGHCIPVDPYYLTYKAQELGYHPQVVLAGRAINDNMPQFVAEMIIKSLNNAGKTLKGSRVLLMGLTYKANVADTRETPVKNLIKHLKEYGIIVLGYDPLLSDASEQFEAEIIENISARKFDCAVITVGHSEFGRVTLKMLKEAMGGNALIIDIPGFYRDFVALEENICYQTI